MMSPPPTIAAIQAAVAHEFRVPARVMVEQSLYREHARPRQVAMYLAYTLTGRSSGIVGRLFGGRDHSTVLQACAALRARRAADRELDARIGRLERTLMQPPAPAPTEYQLAFLDGPLFDPVGGGAAYV